MPSAEKIKEIVRRHRAAFIVSLLIGIVYASFHFFMIREAANHAATYMPVIVEGGFDEGYYALRAAEAFDGRLLVGDINLAEHADSPAFLPILNPLVMATLGRLTGSIENAFMFSDLAFIFIIAILVYFIGFELTGRRMVPVVFTTIFMFAPKLGMFPSSGVIPFLEDARELYFSRFEYPNVTFMFFAAALYFLIRAIKREEQLATYIAGIFAGSLFYTYLYDWLYVYTLLGLLVVCFAVAGRSASAKRVLWIGFIGLLASIPYWVNFFRLTALPSYADIVERIGVERGHLFRFEIVWFSYVRALALIALLWCMGSIRKQKDTLIFMAAALLPILFLLNIQVITGFVPHPDHFHRTQFFASALAFMVIFLALVRAWRQTVFEIPERTQKIAAAVVIVFCLGFGVVNNRALSATNAHFYYADPGYAYAYAWLKGATTRGAVIASISSRTNNEIILYTAGSLFVPNGLHTIASTEEIWTRMMHASKKFNLSPEEFKTAVENQTLYLFTDAYRNAGFNDYFKQTIRKVPEPLLSAKVEEYRALRENSDPSVPFALQYFIVGERERSLGADERFLKTIATEVFKGKGVSVYALENNLR